MAVTPIGNTGTRESWESGLKQKAERNSLELVYTGNYAELAAAMPAKGTTQDAGNGIPQGYEVEHSKLRPLRGLRGELRIVLVESEESAAEKPEGAITSIIEIDMAQLEKPLLSKPGISDAVPAQIELWRDSPANLRLAMKYEQDGDIYDLAGDSLIFAKLILKGVESYLVFAPVVSRTSTYKNRPTPANYGKIETPPVTVEGSWEYLKTADRIVQQADGSYARTEQWTGADEWDRALYEEASS